MIETDSRETVPMPFTSSSRSTKHIRALITNPMMEAQQSVEELENDHPNQSFTQKGPRKHEE